jgi:hypothetical protein
MSFFADETVFYAALVMLVTCDEQVWTGGVLLNSNSKFATPFQRERGRERYEHLPFLTVGLH